MDVAKERRRSIAIAEPPESEACESDIVDVLRHDQLVILRGGPII